MIRSPVFVNKPDSYGVPNQLTPLQDSSTWFQSFPRLLITLPPQIEHGIMDIVRSAVAYKHEYMTPSLRGDSFGSPLPTPMSSNIAENGSHTGSVPPGYSPDNLLSILDFDTRKPPTPDINGQNGQNGQSGYHDPAMIRGKEENPSDHDLYARGEGDIFSFVCVESLANTWKARPLAVATTLCHLPRVGPKHALASLSRRSCKRMPGSRYWAVGCGGWWI